MDVLNLDPHLDRLVRTAWRLGANPKLARLRLRAWAHALGFRGHWLTKSRRYSTTFGQLRGARASWAAKEAAGRDLDEAVLVKRWRYAGSGYLSEGDAVLAATARRERLEARRVAREEAAGWR